jgi:endonuclease/exonuclease/phosphatase family metal-dependent hydrolase
VEALAPAEVRVATFNIHHGVGMNGELDIERTARVIRDTGATVIALQELDRFVPRSGVVDQVSVLEDLCDLKIAFHRTVQMTEGEYGIAIGARDALTTEFVELPRSGSEEPRGLIVARGYGMSFVAAHLSPDRVAGPLQAQMLADVAAAQEGPTVVMGDLNREMKDLGALVAAGFQLGPRRKTAARFLSRRQLDHIAAGHGALLGGTWTLRTNASDHLPLVGEIVV